MTMDALRKLSVQRVLAGSMNALIVADCTWGNQSPQMEGAADGLIDCLVPGQIIQLDENVTYPTQRQLVRSTREECRARGGEEK